MLEDLSILVTGGAGFIGSHLVDALRGWGPQNEVTVLDNLSSGRREHIAHHLLDPDFRFIEADILDPKALEKAVEGKDIIFHLAANPDVRLGALNTRIYLDQNIIGTYNLLEAMRRKDVKRIAFTSTSTVYGEADVIPTPEDYGPLIPISFYGASKLSCEAMIFSYCHTFEMQSWVYRFANIVGERGTHGVLVDFINKLRKNPKELEILGSGMQRKSYMEVRDCIRAMAHCVEGSHDITNIFNIGSEDSVDVERIANIVAEAMGLHDVSYTYTRGVDGRGWKGDVRAMLLSIDKIKGLGWSPEYNSAQSIRIAAEALLKRE
jgi:UDP-glucose 4-epimerase